MTISYPQIQFQFPGQVGNNSS